MLDRIMDRKRLYLINNSIAKRERSFQAGGCQFNNNNEDYLCR